MIFGSQGPSFRQRFLSQHQSMHNENFSVAIELGFEDDFWDGRDSVFINVLSVRSILFAQNMSASAVELGFLDDFWVQGT
jgi:hypothetical protein